MTKCPKTGNFSNTKTITNFPDELMEGVGWLWSPTNPIWQSPTLTSLKSRRSRHSFTTKISWITILHNTTYKVQKRLFCCLNLLNKYNSNAWIKIHSQTIGILRLALSLKFEYMKFKKWFKKMSGFFSIFSKILYIFPKIHTYGWIHRTFAFQKMYTFLSIAVITNQI